MAFGKKAWDNAPRPVPLAPMSNKALFKFEHGAIIRGKKTLFSVDEFKFGAGEWLTITGKNGAGKTSLLESMLQLIKYKGLMTYDNKN